MDRSGWFGLEKGPGLGRKLDGPATGDGVDLMTRQDQVVVELNVQRSQGFPEAPGHGQIRRRREALAGGVVVKQDHRNGV